MNDWLDDQYIERYKGFMAGHKRYEIARTMNPQEWKAAWDENIATGVPFDDIIDRIGKQRQVRTNECIIRQIRT